MAWGPDMNAGFALAALLAHDRDLARVESALPEAALPDLHAQLRLAREGESYVRALLLVLRPELDAQKMRLLAPRMRALLARLLPAHQRKPLLAAAPSSRADFHVEQELLAALARIARGTAHGESS